MENQGVLCLCGVYMSYLFVWFSLLSPPRQQWAISWNSRTKLANILCPISRFLCFSCDLIGSKWVFSTLGRWGQLRASILEITFYHVGRAQGWKLWVAPPLQRKMLVKFPYFVYCSDCIFSKSQVIVWDVWEFWSMKRITSHLVWLLHRWHISLKVFLGTQRVSSSQMHLLLALSVIFPDVTNTFWGKLLASHFYPHGNLAKHIPSDLRTSRMNFCSRNSRRLNNSFTMKGDFRHLKGQNGVPPQKIQKQNRCSKNTKKKVCFFEECLR